jgi:hypothetical protein
LDDCSEECERGSGVLERISADTIESGGLAVCWFNQSQGASALSRIEFRVVDLAKGPAAKGSLARSTTFTSNSLFVTEHSLFKQLHKEKNVHQGRWGFNSSSGHV